ncbi:hypothetical protein LRC537489_15930 [Mycobacterium riyadhense]
MIIGEDRQQGNAAIDRAAQDRLKLIPERGTVKGKSIGSALQDRPSTVSLRSRDVIDGAELDCCQMVRVVRVGEARDTGPPACSQHGDAEVIEYRTTTEDRFPAGMICGGNGSATVDEKVDTSLFGHPSPGLAVVHGRRPTGQLDCVLENHNVHALTVWRLDLG